MQGQQSAASSRWQQASPPSSIAGQGPQQMQGQPSTFAQNPPQTSRSFSQGGASPPSFMAGQGSQQMQDQPSAFARPFIPQREASSHSFMAGQGSQQMQGQPSGFTHVPKWSSPPTYMAGQGGQHQIQGQRSGLTQTTHTASPYSTDGQRAPSMQGLTSGPAHTPLNEISHTSQSLRGPASAFAQIHGQNVRHQAREEASSQGDNVEQYQYPEVARQGRM